MRIALNPHSKKIVALPGLWEGKNNSADMKEPTYLDCFPDKVVIYPGTPPNNQATWEELQRPDNIVTKCLNKVQANRTNQYVVIMARPESVKIFRYIRKMVDERPIEKGYDAVEAKYKVDWDEANKALAVSVEEPDDKKNGAVGAKPVVPEAVKP